MRKQRLYILPPLEQKKIIAIDNAIQQDIQEQHKAFEQIRKDVNNHIQLRYQSQIISLQHNKKVNRQMISQSLYEHQDKEYIPIIHQSQSKPNFINTIKHRYLKSAINIQEQKILKYFEEEDLLELKAYFEIQSVDSMIQGLTLLYRAVKIENLKMISFLVQNKANPYCYQEKWPFRQVTPYSLAKQMNNKEILSLIQTYNQ